MEDPSWNEITRTISSDEGAIVFVFALFTFSILAKMCDNYLNSI